MMKFSTAKFMQKHGLIKTKKRTCDIDIDELLDIQLSQILSRV